MDRQLILWLILILIPILISGIIVMSLYIQSIAQFILRMFRSRADEPKFTNIERYLFILVNYFVVKSLFEFLILVLKN